MKRKANRRGKLTSQEGKLPKHIHHQISTAFDEDKKRVIEEADIKVWDDAEAKPKLLKKSLKHWQNLPLQP